MNTTKRPVRLLAAVVASVLLFSSCTLPQLTTYQSLTGDRLSPEREEALIGLADAPMRMADRSVIEVDGSITPAPPDSRDQVNALPYNHGDTAVVLTAFRLVTADRGWTPEQTASWETAVADIVHLEAGDCWNIRNGGYRFARWDGAGCELSRNGGGAAGYGQITSVIFHIPCNAVGLCDRYAITATPYDSMLALVSLIEYKSDVRGFYCYNSYARRFHRVACNNPGLDV